MVKKKYIGDTMNRRFFIKKLSLTGILSFFSDKIWSLYKPQPNHNISPIAICTWNFKKANAAAGQALSRGVDALSAAILAAEIEEANPLNSTVGYGGAPDRTGHVSLDACVMDHKGNCGAVLATENVKHVAALARDVMNNTPHVMLAGKGAENFAAESGYLIEPLLTPEQQKKWEIWRKKGNYQPEINVENHDTIGILCRDSLGNISGVCSSSGLAYKMRGRIGDSPIIGSGLYVDNSVGGAVATGMGEEVVKTVGSFLIVELMRQGKHPQVACEEAISRIINKQKEVPNFQVAFLALNKNGTVGSSAIHPGFSYMHYQNENNTNHKVAPFQ